MVFKTSDENHGCAMRLYIMLNQLLYIKHAVSVFLLMLIPFIATNAYAYSFVPTEAEYGRWPYYCKSMYAKTQIGKRNGFWKRIPKADADKWFLIGNKNGGAWHYCGGLVWLERAQAAVKDWKKEEGYQAALGAARFSLDRNEPTSPWSSMYLILMGRAYRGLKDYPSAIKVLQAAMSNHPNQSNSYIILSLVYQDMKKYKLAKKSLLRGLKHAKGKKSEIIYILGHVSLELGEINKAKDYAKQAVALGYPLKGLSKKIEKYENKQFK